MSLVVPFEEIFAQKQGLLSNHSSWRRVELGEICRILNGFAFKSSLFNNEKGFPVIRIRDLSKGRAETLYNGVFPPEYIVDNGDLLIGMDGNFTCWEWSGGKAGLNQRVCKIMPNEAFLNRKFLLYGLNGYLKAIQDCTSSVTVGHLSSLDILRIPFPLPPLNEQRRIVAKLELLLSRVDACQQRLARIPVILKRFRQAVLAAACSGRFTADWREKQGIGEGDDLPEGWRKSDIEMVSNSLKYGTSQKCTYENKGTPVLRIPNIQDGTVNHSDLKFAELPIKEMQQLSLLPGDILVIRSNGSVSLVGKSALVREAERDFAYAGYLIRIRPNRNIIQPEYLNLVLGSYGVRLQIEIPARSTSGVNNINSDELRALSFSLPPLPEQQEIVRRVEALFTLADQLEARYATAQVQVDKLTQSILAKAFRGELVPQDPSDEPAEKLLERIRERQETVAAQPRKKKFPSVQAVQDSQPVSASPEQTVTTPPDLSKTARKILRHMKKSHTYTKHELTTAAILSTSEWNCAIRELKEAGLVIQTGDKRGAAYHKA